MKTLPLAALVLLCASMAATLNAQAVIFSQNFDAVTAPALPTGWTVSGIGAGQDWATRITGPDTAPNCVFTNDVATVSDRYLDSPPILLPGATNTLSFRHNYDTEATFDGGVLEIKVGSGAFADIVVAGGVFTAGAYTGPISVAFQSPIGGRNAWNGLSAGYVTSTITLPVAAQGQTVQFRWRMACDDSLSATGWSVDTISISTAGPQLTVAAVAGAAQSVYNNAAGPGGNGLHAGTFTIASNGLAGASLMAVQIQAAGTGNDQSAYSQVALWRDSNDTSAFEPGGDTLIDAAATAFPSDNGALNFNVQAAEQVYAASITRRFFIVVKLSGAATQGQTFNFNVSDITVTGTNSSKAGVPSALIQGLSIVAPGFVFTDASPAAPLSATVGSADNLCQQFTIGYPGGPDNQLTSITVTAAGTGNDLAHVTRVVLWLDDGSTLFEPAQDTIIDDAAYSADNGTAVFDTSAQPMFQATNTRTYFVTYDFNLAGQHNQTFKCFVSAAGGAMYGAVNNGLPAPSAMGTPGIVLSVVLLSATLNGPGIAFTVQNNSVGVSGSGELLCDVTITAAAGLAWNMGGLVFSAAGTAAHDTAFSEIGLYEDSGNGIWDGGGNDGAAAASLPGFGAGPGFQASFTLANGVFNPGVPRRFFLAGKLGGTATTGQTLNARLESTMGGFPPGGVQIGFPTATSTALIIASSVLTVLNAPNAPGNVMHKTGTPLAFTMGKFRFGASNGAVNITGVALTTTGTGNWPASMDAATGIQAYLDDGDGFFDGGGSDTLLYQGPGAAVSNAVFSTPIVVPTRGTRDLWVRVNLLATAGAGAATPASFSMAIVQATDVAASVSVLVGTPAPVGAILSVVDFFVTGVDPLTDALAGGKALTITGSGFLSPFTVTIGGIVCPGTPTVTPTEVTGLRVPSGIGSAQPIVVSSGTLVPITLTQTFDYRNPGNPAGNPGGSGCVQGASGTMALAALMPALLAMRRRRRV